MNEFSLMAWAGAIVAVALVLVWFALQAGALLGQGLADALTRFMPW